MNKAILILSIISFSFLNSQAQINKGATFLGGNLGTYNYRSSDANADTQFYKARSISVSLSFGKAIKENLVLGAGVHWQQQKSSAVNPGTEYKLTGQGADVFLRKYKKLGNSAFYLFGQVALEFDVIKEDKTDDISKIKGSRWNVYANLTPGISFAVSKRFQIETGMSDVASLWYGVQKERRELPGAKEQTITTLAFSSSIDNLSGLYLGFRVLLN